MNFDAIATAWAPRLLSILRIMAGLLLLQHGTGKYLKFPAGAVPPTFDLNSWPGYAGIIELVCGLLLVLGPFSRPAAFIASGLTALAYFIAPPPPGFFSLLDSRELAVLYCFVFLYLAAAGPGPWSLDAQRRR